MDLETENRIASILMKEAAELRRQADKEGVHVYLRERNVRFRPNSRFLTATVLGVQQANRVAEVNEMWRVRKKEQELDSRLKGSSRDKRSYMDHNESARDTTTRRIEHNDTLRSSSSGHREHISNNAGSSKSQVDGSYLDGDEVDDSYSDDGGLKDEDVQQFLHSRVKRGRGGVGARMDEPGPYLPLAGSDSKNSLSESPDVRKREEWECRVLGPEKPPSFRFNRSLEDVNEDNWEKAKKPKLESSKKPSKKHSRKEDKRAKKERKERKSKHKHRSKHRSSH